MIQKVKCSPKIGSDLSRIQKAGKIGLDIYTRGMENLNTGGHFSMEIMPNFENFS
jgi:hypothetical protein